MRGWFFRFCCKPRRFQRFTPPVASAHRPPPSPVVRLASLPTLRFLTRLGVRTALTQRLNVAVVIHPALSERHDVVSNRGRAHSALRPTHTTERLPGEERLTSCLQLPPAHARHRPPVRIPSVRWLRLRLRPTPRTEATIGQLPATQSRVRARMLRSHGHQSAAPFSWPTEETAVASSAAATAWSASSPRTSTTARPVF